MSDFRSRLVNDTETYERSCKKSIYIILFRNEVVKVLFSDDIDHQG